MNLDKTNAWIETFDRLVQEGASRPHEGTLYTGVDLGTASIVLCVVDEGGNLVAGAMERAQAVRDGVVVDFIGAVRVTRRLKEALEARLGAVLTLAGAAIPPGVGEGAEKVVKNVLESAGFETLVLTEEPTAAALFLGLEEGAVVDIGGGTTGVSVLEGGQVLLTCDEATGGHHMNLVLSGRYGIPYEAAEAMKCTPDRRREVLPALYPVIEKMADIVGRVLAERPGMPVCLVGGGATLEGFEAHFAKRLNRPTVKPAMPMYVTPIGIALTTQREGRRHA